MFSKYLSALLFLALSISAYGQAEAEWRSYSSQDGARTFDGQLLGYDEQAKEVTVLNRQRQTLSFSLDLLSEKDREYIIATAPTLPVRANLDVRFLEQRERQDSSRTGTTRRTESEGGYTITITNFTPLDLRNARVEYLVIYRKDSPTGAATNEILRGSQTLDIEANGRHEIETSTVSLVNFQRRAQPG